MERKRITIPCGATCVIRKLSRMDLLGADRIPVAYVSEIAAKGSKVDPEEATRFALLIGQVALTRACGKLQMPDGKNLKIVSKPFDECGPGEISVEELADEDADVIVAEIMKLTNISQEAGRATAPFLQGQAGPDSPGSDGAALRGSAHPAPEAAAG